MVSNGCFDFNKHSASMSCERAAAKRERLTPNRFKRASLATSLVHQIASKPINISHSFEAREQMVCWERFRHWLNSISAFFCCLSFFVFAPSSRLISLFRIYGDSRCAIWKSNMMSWAIMANYTRIRFQAKPIHFKRNNLHLKSLCHFLRLAQPT